MKKLLLLTTAILFAGSVSAKEYHVSVKGDDANNGSKRSPLETIQAAAEKAMPGDVITVHEGTYRERINPPRGGTSDKKRITYQAAKGEKVTITGSEAAKGWKKVSGDTWKLVLPNSYFGDFNPYSEKVFGDWFNGQGRVHHRGMVYLNNHWHLEAANLDSVMKPVGQRPLWFAQVDGKGGSETDNTVIYAQFKGVNPNESNVEINVRDTVFTPEKTNIDYITVRGFDLRNACPNWAAPTSGQQGLVTAYWCKGWIIENNEISYSRCCGVTLGKYSDEWDYRRGNKSGYDGTIDKALKDGWSKENIGSHIVRNNHIHHCEQTGIVGSLGCSFSRVEGNEIHDIHNQGFWGGAEMAGLKFHAAIDVVIKDNHFYRCGSLGGVWLDWMAQGAHVIGNLFHDNGGTDIFMEVNHGPFLIANNIMLSPGAYRANSEGGAYAHNLILGGMSIMTDGRRTPYHKPHSTEVVGTHNCLVGDLRWYNNLLASRVNLNACDRATWPVVASGNVFTKGARVSKFDKEVLVKPNFDPGIKLTQEDKEWYLEINADSKWAEEQKRQLVTTEILGKAKIPDQEFTNPDGSSLKIDHDYSGKKRDSTNPFPGPFEVKDGGKLKLKVWPKD